MKKLKEGDKTIVSYSQEELKNLPSETDWDRVDAMTDEELTANALSDPDVLPVDEGFFAAAQMMTLEDLIAQQKKRKQQVTIRLKTKTLEWFKSKGRGYQTKISALLDYYVEQEQAKVASGGIMVYRSAKSGAFTPVAAAKKSVKKPPHKKRETA